MAKSIKQWMEDMIATKEADPVIGIGGPSELNSTSLVAVWRLWAYLAAKAMKELGEYFDTHKAEVTGLIVAQKAHRLQWYQTKALAFQYGVSLPADADVYALVPPTDTAVLIVTNAAAIELSNLLRIKVAKGTAGALTALSVGELSAFSGYMARIKDAGVRLQCTSAAGDTFQPTMIIFYDPLVLDGTGARIDSTSATPVKDAVNKFLISLDFNGRLFLNGFIAAMQAVDGVVVADEVSIQAFYGATPPVVISTWYVPDAGYLDLDDAWFDAHVTYVPYS
jgi:hypothetical protein